MITPNGPRQEPSIAKQGKTGITVTSQGMVDRIMAIIKSCFAFSAKIETSEKMPQGTTVIQCPTQEERDQILDLVQQEDEALDESEPVTLEPVDESIELLEPEVDFSDFDRELKRDSVDLKSLANAPSNTPDSACSIITDKPFTFRTDKALEDYGKEGRHYAELAMNSPIVSDYGRDQIKRFLENDPNRPVDKTFYEEFSAMAKVFDSELTRTGQFPQSTVVRDQFEKYGLDHWLSKEGMTGALIKEGRAEYTQTGIDLQLFAYRIYLARHRTTRGD